MLRLTVAAAVLAATAAHMSVSSTCAVDDIECYQRAGEQHREPAWVAHFSTAASGPEQIWINYGATPDAMAFRWLTADTTAKSTVQWGTASGNYPNTASGSADQYTYGKYTSGLIHTTTVTGLPLNTTIFYRVGDQVTGYSQEYSFTSNPGVGSSANYYPYTVAFLADVGESDAANSTIAHILDQDSLSVINSVIINGDIAYASGCEATGCTVWDAWGRLAQPLAAIKPWSVSIGNHELYDTANGITAISATYRYRGMPTAGRSDALMYFSWESGPVHFISFCSFYAQGFGSGSPVVQWIEADLAAVDKTKTPWIVVSQHAPWYNSNTEHQGDGEPARVGLEALFIKYGVSILFNGHVHAYERSYPVNDNKVVQAGPGGMTHFNIGDGGASLYTTWINPIPKWSAVHSATFGHGRWQVINATHSYWTWHENSKPEPSVSDSVYILNSNQAAWEL